MSDVREKIKGKGDLLPNMNKLIDDDFNVDEFIRKRVKGLGDKPPKWEVDPFQLEANFEDVGRLLERLLDLRRDIWELSAIIQKTALQYISAVEQVEADNALQIAQASDPVRQKVEEAARKRIDSTRASVKLLESRHGEPGNALNYAERLNKMKDVLAKDIESCYVRSRAVESEAGDRYVLDLPMPEAREDQKLLYVDFSGAAFMDDWSAWHRKLARDLELKQAAEPVHEVVISLGQYQLVESFDDTFGETEEPIVLSNDIAKGIKSDNGMTVNLNRTENPKPGFVIDRRIIPSLCGNARIVGVQVLIETTAESRGMAWRFNVQVKAPMATQSVVLTAASPTVPPIWFVSPAFVNRPAKGEWYFRIISAVAENSNPELAKRESWPITDVKLALRLSGI